MSFQVVSEPITNYFFENFRENAKEGDRAVVIHVKTIPRFEDRNNFSYFEGGRDMTSGE